MFKLLLHKGIFLKNFAILRLATYPTEKSNILTDGYFIMTKWLLNGYSWGEVGKGKWKLRCNSLYRREGIIKFWAINELELTPH